MLKMKNQCEKCKQSIALDGTAYICSFECTFCDSCSDEMLYNCPNCDGNLVLRPFRKRKVIDAALTNYGRKLSRDPNFRK